MWGPGPWPPRGEVLASLEVAEPPAPAARACSAGTASTAPCCCGPARSVHTVGHALPHRRGVLRRRPAGPPGGDHAPHRLSRLVWRSRAVIEAEAGSFARWNLRPGDQLEVKG